LDNGQPVRSIPFTPDEVAIVKQLPLITAKPLIYACNIDVDSMAAGTNELADRFVKYVNEKYPQIPVVILSALLENDLVKIRNEDGEDQANEFMEMYGLKESKLDQLLEHCSNVLSL
jgi:ribosome-binding ATPase